ncbi:unnamed protein product [Aspergillus oryzae]|nr:unnamed protein product [Aspergillus oryzae]GMF97427.1 unnamed protein product [Aspergillus oryzae]
MEKRDNEAWRKGSHRPKGQYKSNDQRERTGAKHNNPYGLKPMELDATEGQGHNLQDTIEQWYGQLSEHEIDELADHANNKTDRLGRVNSESQYEAIMEPIRRRVRYALTHRVDGPDNTNQYNEPVSSIDQSNRVLIEIDPLNEEYSTQWIGHDPNMEELLKVPETPENPQDKDENTHRRVIALINTLQKIILPRQRAPISRLY